MNLPIRIELSCFFSALHVFAEILNYELLNFEHTSIIKEGCGLRDNSMVGFCPATSSTACVPIVTCISLRSGN